MSLCTPSGGAAEDAVALHLERRRWRIVARRLRLGALEVDLLVRRGRVVALVEVRGRRLGSWVEPFDSVNRVKRQRLVRAARTLWARRFTDDSSVAVIRIDLAAVTWTPDGPQIEIAEGAVPIDL